MTDDVVQATCQCLLEQAAEAESVRSFYFRIFSLCLLRFNVYIPQDKMRRENSQMLLTLFYSDGIDGSSSYPGTCHVALSTP